jgi:hypothetical protein
MQQQPALALLSLLAVLAPTTARAETEVFGCGANPAGSLAVLAGDARLGTTFVIGLDNPLGTQTPGTIGLVWVSAAADPAHPCGTPAYGLGLSSVAVPGELLVDLSNASLVALFFTTPWLGPGLHAEAAIDVPANPSLAGIELFAQGFLVDPSGLGSVTVGATEGLRFVLESACSELEPCLDLTAQSRRAYAESRAFDWEYDGGVTDEAEPVGVATHWSALASVDHADWYGTPIGASRAAVTSVVAARRVTVDMDLAARTEGNLFQEDAYAEGVLEVAFDVPVRVRFALSATGTPSGGYADATASLAGNGDTLVAIGAFQGQSDARSAVGWLQVGSHTLSAAAHVFAYGTSTGGGQSEEHTARLALALAIHHQCDMDGDGDVDQTDREDFLDELQSGSLDADIDGDGDADALDGLVYDSAWSSVQ